MNNVSRNSYPGDGNRWIICDNCGRKRHVKDTVLVSDPYGPQNGRRVCKDEVELVSAGKKPYTVRPSRVPDPNSVRPEQPEVFVNAQTIADVLAGTGSYNAGRTPDAPSQLIVYVGFDGYVTLDWMLFGNPGSTAITGFQIERESPVGGGFSTIKADTENAGHMYQDLTAVSGNTYNYRVSAINQSGVGSASNTYAITI